jgi:adenosylcobinamide-GDP ribazoletransferase
MAEWLRLFLIAIQFLTRLPVPADLKVSEETLGKAAKFFPLVGVMVGAGASLTFWLLQYALPHSAAVLGAIIFTAFITNGFHEDGLADAFDGFGGGWTKEQALEIMRDSRLGTYGALALVFLILGKYSFLSSIASDASGAFRAPGQVWRWLIVAHTASRWTVLPLCAWLPYARAEGQGKLVAKQIGGVEILVGSVTLFATVLLLSWQAALAAVLITGLTTLLSGFYYRARLSGVTGDCLGATNQITEVSLYLTAVILSRFDLL